MKVWDLPNYVKQWPVTSQQGARRNALVAATTLTRRRIERAEVDAFIKAASQRQEVRRNRAAIG